MKISLITPAPQQSRDGNRTTAMRWARIFRLLGHDVRIAVSYDGAPADLMVALHAWRSAASIDRFRALYPDRPLVVALTGTDIYDFIDSEPETTLGALTAADALVGLHELVQAAIPKRFHDKLGIIVQSVTPPRRRSAPLKRCFEIVVIGHLRDVKDPLRAAIAARDLPAASLIRIVHLGRAHESGWAERARREMVENQRYDWRGEVSGGTVRRMLARSRLMVLSSIAEGGANVVSEAVAAGVPILASEIDGSVGLLGRDYPGYFPVGDTAALTALMRRTEEEPGFLDQLRAHVVARAPLFEPAMEEDAWRRLLARLFDTSRAKCRVGGGARDNDRV